MWITCEYDVDSMWITFKNPHFKGNKMWKYIFTKYDLQIRFFCEYNLYTRR